MHAHPGLGGQEPAGCIGDYDAPAKGHIAQKPVHVERIPPRRIDDMPDVTELAALPINSSGDIMNAIQESARNISMIPMTFSTTDMLR